MWPESAEENKPLRTGLTTGTCATVCVMAAAQALIAQREDPKAFVVLPKGQKVSQAILYYQYLNSAVKTATIKDGGDDPDATHGAVVWAEVRLTKHKGIFFIAGEGVGTVTRSGLVLDVGEPAINPIPRKMMMENLTSFAAAYGYEGGFELTIGIENGDQIAQKTMNPRLGILGGLSILGTTGIVRPFSCAAYIASIHQGIDVARANTLNHIAATTGNASESAIKAHYGLTEMALIEMGDFVGAVLKHIRKVEKEPQLKKLSICGGFGKISKLAQRNMDLNSRASSINLDALADTALTLGASSSLHEKMRLANTSVEALKFAQLEGLALADVVCAQALHFCREYIPDYMELEVYAIDRSGRFVGHAKG
ncbi:cobalt-precorrin-5B (C(1))-methyltransferase [Marinomonas balearica]|uniref:Cobalt-precorrin-5B C(1)-methyltransferase n=1 Tax=Marinomonas balearica TaxID=491947 RepID=A0A4R6MF78_9GAMM|nr:cobalt-precorrin-5B (C(1))-methyltransferase [Marinomonas balearica]TDO99400.1 cobalt-precorrin-5B (C1)-methyltransferase [Marinomonas balearica]